MNYQLFGSRGFHLRLRMYDGSRTKYIVVNNLLKGDLQRKHFNAKKQYFIPSAPFADENNEILSDFMRKRKKTMNADDSNLFGYTQKKKIVQDKKITMLHELMDWCVENAKKSTHDDGTISGTFETYIKVQKRLQEYCDYIHEDYEGIRLSDIDSAFINGLLAWKRQDNGGKGVQYLSSMFRSALNKGDKKGWYDFKKCKGADWVPKTRIKIRKYETLTMEQCQRFIDMDPNELPKSNLGTLYRDFCVFILYTCQSTCDALSLKYSSIKVINGVEHFVFMRRKIETKQSTECTVPINPIMKTIMNKYKSVSADGYIFPIRSQSRIKRQKNNNGDIKHFISKINIWLEKVGNILGCPFKLHTYVFRHTGITHYISKGIPVIYVANLAGTSVKNCENIYYNNQGDVASRDKVLNAVNF